MQSPRPPTITHPISPEADQTIREEAKKRSVTMAEVLTRLLCLALPVDDDDQKPPKVIVNKFPSNRAWAKRPVRYKIEPPLKKEIQLEALSHGITVSLWAYWVVERGGALLRDNPDLIPFPAPATEGP